MAARIYSRPLISASGVTDGDHVFTVPIGHVYIVRAVTAYAHTVLDSPKVVFKDFTSGAVLWYRNWDPASRKSFESDTHWAFLGGEQAGFSVDSGGILGDGVDVYASGYDLIAPTFP